MIIPVLEVAVALVFFANKVFLLIGKRSGWLLGFIAAVIALAYFFLLQLYVFTVLEVGLIILMGYGFWRKEAANIRVEQFLRVTITIVMLALMLFVFAGLMTIVEFVSATIMLWGTYLLVHDSVRLGWVLFGAAHCLAAAVGFHKLQPFFADFQIASAIVSVAGVVKGGPKIIESSA